MLVNHIAEEIGRLVNVLVVNLESNLTSDAGALTRSLVRNIKMRREDTSSSSTILRLAKIKCSLFLSDLSAPRKRYVQLYIFEIFEA